MSLLKMFGYISNKFICIALFIFVSASLNLTQVFSAEQNKRNFVGTGIFSFSDLRLQKKPFVASVGGEAFIIEERFNGVSKKTLKTSLSVFKAFGLTSDGQKILYIPLKDNRPSGELFLEDLQTGERKKITRQLVISAAISPVDDNLIAFIFSGGKNFGLAIAEVDSGKITVLPTENIFTEIIEWDASGNGIHFLNTVNANGNFKLEKDYVSINSSTSTTISPLKSPNEFPIIEKSSLSERNFYPFFEKGENSFQINSPDGIYQIRGNDLTDAGYLLAINNLTGEISQIGNGQFIKASAQGILFQEISTSGTELFFADWKGNKTKLGTTVVNYNLPLQNSTLIQGGTGYNAPGNCSISSHSGVMEFAYDLKSAVSGSHVLSAADGLVVFNSAANDCPNCGGTFLGETVIIQHADGTYSKYSHLESGSPQVAVGTDICQGLYIARQGSTGSTSGVEHLHFQRQTSADIFGQSVAVDFSDTSSNPLSCSSNYNSASTEKAHSISPASQNFGISGGVGSVTVTSTGCSWSAVSNDSWITLTYAGSGSGNDTVTFSVADNSAGGARTGTMNIGGHIFTVTQSGGGVTNQPPTVNAGADQIVTLPNSATLSGTANDDNLPNPPATLATTWSKVSGPGTVTFSNPNSLNTTADFSIAGIYVLRLTADDGALSSNDDLTITVNAASGGGSLTGNRATTPSNVNLPTEGTTDWTHWGLNSATTFNHKNGVTPQISNYTMIGTNSPLRYTNNPNTYSWTGGTPTSNTSNTKTGSYVYGVGNGFQLTVPADTTQRTLKLYVGLWSAGGRLEATISDGSASPYIDTSLVNATGTSNTVYVINYQAASSGQTLTIKWTVETAYHAVGNVTLQAAALSINAPPTNQPPTVNAGADQIVTLPNSATLSGTANDDNLPNPPATLTTTWSKISGPGTVTFGNPNSLNTTADFSIAGNYVLRLTADDSALSSFDEVNITVNNAGSSTGSISVSGATAPSNINLTSEGVNDWAHWGLGSPSAFNHKSNITPQISNYTRIGSGSVMNFSDNLILYSWSDGTPVGTANNTGSAVFIMGVNKGFEINIPADTALRTLKFYGGIYAAQGRLEASLSDSSAPTVADTSLINQNGTSNAVFTINFKAASNGQNLKVKWTATATYNQWGNVTLQAATLSGGNGVPVNQAPTVNAGQDQNITLPNSASLSGTASDDGLPNPPSSITTTWSKISGPGTVTFGNANALNTTADFSTAGNYVLRLTANDGELTATDDLTINVSNQIPTNQPPTVNAGTDQTITLPASANLSGTASDDNLPNPPATLATTWSKVSGPGTVTFGNSNASTTTASFSTAGNYVLRLTADDSALSVTDDVSITVNNSGSSTGSISVGSVSSPANVDLTTEGVNDWAHWGLNSASAFNHKSGVVQQISNYTKIGSGSVLNFNNNSVAFNWNDGSPINSATNNRSAVYIMGLNKGFELNIPVDTTQKTLKLYLGVYAAQGRLEASLSDSSAPTVVDTSLINQNGTSNAVFTINFKAASNGQNLKVKWTATATYNQWGNVTLQAATLVGNGGTPQPSGEFQISSSAPYAQYATHIAKNSSGDFVVAWQSNGQDGSGWGIFARKYNAAGVPLTDEFQVNTYTLDNQFVPRAAMDANGNFVIVWESKDHDGSGYGIFGRRYNSAGVPLGGEFQINTHISDDQHDPAIAMSPNGNFVVVWTSDLQDGSLDGIFGQRFDSAGVPQGAEFQVNNYTNDSQGQSKVSMDTNGNFVVSWESNGQDGSGLGIYAQRFDSAGVPQGTEFRVNSATSNDQFENWSAMSPTGEFVIVWCSTGQDGSGSGIFGQRYNAAGVPQGGEFQVNTFTASNQLYPAVALDASNNFVVVWESFNQDGSGKGIYGQRYNAAGILQGIEFQINDFTANNQSDPYVAKDSVGDFVVIWTSSGQDGSGDGVFGKRYDAAGNELTAP